MTAILSMFADFSSIVVERLRFILAEGTFVSNSPILTGRRGTPESVTSIPPDRIDAAGELADPRSGCAGDGGAGDIWLEESASTNESISVADFFPLKDRNWREDREDCLDDVVDTERSAGSVKGMRNENRLPSSTLESTRSWPPSCSTIRATTASPRPA